MQCSSTHLVDLLENLLSPLDKLGDPSAYLDPDPGASLVVFLVRDWCSPLPETFATG